MAQDMKVYTIHQHNSYGLNLNILAKSEEEAKEKFEELTDEGQFNYDELKSEWFDCDKPEVVEEQALEELYDDECIFVEGKEYTKKNYLANSESIDEEKEGLRKTWSSELDYYFGKIENMDGVREMFYPGGPIDGMLENLTPEEFMKVFQEKKEEFEEYHAARQKEARDLAHGTLANVFEKSIGFYPKHIEDWFNNNLDINFLGFEFWTDTANQNIIVEIDIPDGIDDLINKIQEFACNYNVSEEVEIYLPIRGNNGVPEDIDTLKDDMQEAKDTLTELSENLNLWRNCSDEYKQIKKKENQDKEKSYASAQRDAVKDNKRAAGEDNPTKNKNLKQEGR